MAHISYSYTDIYTHIHAWHVVGAACSSSRGCSSVSRRPQRGGRQRAEGWRRRARSWLLFFLFLETQMTNPFYISYYILSTVSAPEPGCAQASRCAHGRRSIWVPPGTGVLIRRRPVSTVSGGRGGRDAGIPDLLEAREPAGPADGQTDADAGHAHSGLWAQLEAEPSCIQLVLAARAHEAARCPCVLFFTWSIWSCIL